MFMSSASSVLATLVAAIHAGIGAMLYFFVLLVGSAFNAAWFRRHLRVRQVFTPRCMSAQMLFVDVAVLVGIWVGVGKVTQRVKAISDARN